MLIRRTIEKHILSGAKQVPVIAIIGPRQSGKSTIAKALFKNHTYVDMQDAAALEFALQDPKGFLKSLKSDHGVIIDEAQYAPNLFAQIKVEADKDPRPGYFVLSGSQNFLLHEKISESLAGRVYFYTLLPFSIAELNNAQRTLERPEQQILRGFYPRVYQPHVQAREYYENYISTYVERDIRTIRNIDNILVFKKFMSLCALRIGRTINFTDLATECGIAVATAKSWIALLETSFVLFLLPPYHNNLGKRITKSPKLYFYDVGLATALMNFDSDTIIKNRTIYGGLFENMVIVDIIKNCHGQNFRPSLSFFRDSNHNEVDLIIEAHGQITPIEIKASETINTRFFDTITWFKQNTENTAQPVIFYGGSEQQTRSIGNVFPWTDGAECITKITQLKE